MAKKPRSTSRTVKVAVGIGTALGRLQAQLDRLRRQSAADPTGIKATLKRAQSLLSAIGPNTSGDQVKPRKATKKATKKSTKPRRKVSTASKPGSKARRL